MCTHLHYPTECTAPSLPAGNHADWQWCGSSISCGPSCSNAGKTALSLTIVLQWKHRQKASSAQPPTGMLHSRLVPSQNLWASTITHVFLLPAQVHLSTAFQNAPCACCVERVPHTLPQLLCVDVGQTCPGSPGLWFGGMTLLEAGLTCTVQELCSLSGPHSYSCLVTCSDRRVHDGAFGDATGQRVLQER